MNESSEQDISNSPEGEAPKNEEEKLARLIMRAVREVTAETHESEGNPMNQERIYKLARDQRTEIMDEIIDDLPEDSGDFRTIMNFIDGLGVDEAEVTRILTAYLREHPLSEERKRLLTSNEERGTIEV